MNQYLGGHDNLKKVINSPALDHRGKMLSYDGTKVFTANGRFRNNSRFNGGRGRGKNRNQNDNRDGKNNRNGNNRGGSQGQKNGRNSVSIVTF